jgi:hypothetical protein
MLVSSSCVNITVEAYIDTTEERIYVDCPEDVKYWLSKKLKQLNET